MLPPRSAIGRIPRHIRPVHPPRIPGPHVHLRPFTNRTRLLLLSPVPGRPQLPFLSPLAPTRPLPPLSIHLRQHFARLISTESRDHYKRRIARGLKIGLTFYAILVLFQVIKVGVYQEEIEHKWPTPPEWTWKSRWCLRSAEALQHPDQIGKLMTSWPMVTGFLRELLERLENPEGEGKGIVEQDEGGFLVEGVGRRGHHAENPGPARHRIRRGQRDAHLVLLAAGDLGRRRHAHPAGPGAVGAAAHVRREIGAGSASL